MNWRKPLTRRLRSTMRDENFLAWLGSVESLVSKTLSIAMVTVILVTVVDLGIFLIRVMFSSPYDGFLKTSLKEVFGLFLSVLIALEILENITAYLKKHVVQVELVIVTSLIAVARKIIILDLQSVDGVSLVGLAIAILSLSVSYWIIRNIHQ
ncbi:MAG: phosphate-starvation-inducible PsiE family protein [Pseudanabaenales cyanobacterium]|nr:phosphate-starvation-inducible PsiE family protein [Pseudanabaenales cyanobacterium]